MPPIGVVVNACEKKKILRIVSTAIDNASVTFPLLFFGSHTVKANEVANQFLVCSACIEKREVWTLKIRGSIYYGAKD